MTKTSKLGAVVAAIMSAVLLIAGPAKASMILFGIVDDTSYYSNGTGLAGFLTADGHTVTVVNMADSSVGDLSAYDQVWVYDLVTGANNNATQVTNYGLIADWYLAGSSGMDLIVDGRIISSNYTTGIAVGYEPEWIQGYANALSTDGGLVLGTDHDVFTLGINTINSLIGIDPFTGNFQQQPYQATVDLTSPLYTVGSTFDCSSGDGQCIWDHSSTSFVPTGDFTLTNGDEITLSPVAFHGHTSDAWANAAVASTFGSIIFGTCGGEDQPPCVGSDDVPEPGPIGLIGFGLFLVALRRYRSV
jgi:hypothetical protein